jgi:hypothetical protein
MSSQLRADASALSEALGGEGTAETRFGLGFKLQAYRGRRVAGHSGGGPGFNLGLWLLPDDDAALIVLSSDTRVRLKEILETFVEALVTEGMLSR